MSRPGGARRRGQSSPARDLSQARPLSLFPSSESDQEVAIPREAADLRKVAIPPERAITDRWAIPPERARGDAWAIPPENARHRASGAKAGKLKLAESLAGARKSWTIPTSRQSGEALRVRRSDAGYAVSLRFRDQSDELREPYLCYLTADEWGEARRGSVNQIVGLVGEKMRRRKDARALAELISRLEATAMNGPERRNTR
jgi:hypothetical protein